MKINKQAERAGRIIRDLGGRLLCSRGIKNGGGFHVYLHYQLGAGTVLVHAWPPLPNGGVEIFLPLDELRWDDITEELRCYKAATMPSGRNEINPRLPEDKGDE